LGLISDIHGNEVALDAVVADGTRIGVSAWWVLGDLVAIGPDPVATLDRLQNLPNARFVRGNTDRYVVSGDRPPPHAHDVERDSRLRDLFVAIEASFTWTKNQFSRPELAWLASLPSEQRAELADGTRLLAIHASPSSDDGSGITPGAPAAELYALLSGCNADIVCGGHTHQATDRMVGSIRAVNLGSVSNPITTDLRATYVVIDDDPRGHRLAHRRVGYDHDAVIRRIEGSTHPEARYLTSFQRGAQILHPADRDGAPEYAD
jgi:predicted phosphodiesterase